MPGIDQKLTELGYPRPAEIDLDSDTLRQELESVAPTLASFAARAWLVAFDFDAVDAPEWVGDLLRGLLDGAGLSCTIEDHDDGSVTVRVGTHPARRFELDFDEGEDATAELAMATAGLAAALLAEHDWCLVEDSNGEEIILAAVPSSCWDALTTTERGTLNPIEPHANRWSGPAEPMWN